MGDQESERSSDVCLPSHACLSRLQQACMGPAGIPLWKLDRRCNIVTFAIARVQLVGSSRALPRARDIFQVKSSPSCTVSAPARPRVLKRVNEPQDTDPIGAGRSIRSAADKPGKGVSRLPNTGRILIGAGFPRCMALKGGSVGVRNGLESDGFTTNAEEQADARALKEQMEARTASSPVPAGMRE